MWQGAPLRRSKHHCATTATIPLPRGAGRGGLACCAAGAAWRFCRADRQRTCVAHTDPASRRPGAGTGGAAGAPRRSQTNAGWLRPHLRCALVYPRSAVRWRARAAAAAAAIVPARRASRHADCRPARCPPALPRGTRHRPRAPLLQPDERRLAAPSHHNIIVLCKGVARRTRAAPSRGQRAALAGYHHVRCPHQPCLALRPAHGAAGMLVEKTACACANRAHGPRCYTRLYKAKPRHCARRPVPPAAAKLRARDRLHSRTHANKERAHRLG